MMTANEIRKKFLDFFARKGHRIVESDSLVPKDDPTVLFTTAGMQQFKRQFLGHIEGYARVATCQKCLRTDDLDQVGKTSFHHTFFEMLGNFSFGDYFKEDAIKWAWEFLTEELNIPKEKLWVSVYKEDSEAKDIWLNKVGIPKEKVVPLEDKSNFWPSEAKEKGPNGPCGPCSEIFYDYGVNPNCDKKEKCNPNCNCGRFSEVWNLVFTQFNRKDPSTSSGQSGGILEPLPTKNIDTGMGLERLVAIVQGKRSNYETDLFEPILQAIRDEIESKEISLYQRDKLVIADHIRAIVFGIVDGVGPSNKKRGSVIKKLIRGCTDLVLIKEVIKEPSIYKLVPSVIRVMKEKYPELVTENDRISSIIKRGEEDYIKNWNIQIPTVKAILLGWKDSEVFAGEIKLAPSFRNDQQRNKLIGEYCFNKAYSTYGLSESTIRMILFDIGIVDHDLEDIWGIFSRKLEEEKERSRMSSKMIGEVFAGAELNLNVSKTKFLGYESFVGTGKILKLFKNLSFPNALVGNPDEAMIGPPTKTFGGDSSNNKEVESVQEGDSIKIILDQTPFYAESGGQVGDTGIIKSLSFPNAFPSCRGLPLVVVGNPEEAIPRPPTKTFGGDNPIENASTIRITDTQRIADVFIHTGTVTKGSFKVNDMVQTQIDEERRRSIMRNHTATHLLQAALRKVLGSHVQQQGSLVAEDRLRFDFTHHQPLTKEQIVAIESWVNSTIMACDVVDKKVMPLSEAKASGALAFFAEKYGETVRVVSIDGYSKEFCGGTHLNFTGQIGSFKVVSEGSVAQGIRRIEAVTGEAVLKYFNTQKEKVDKDLRAQALRVKQLEKEIETLRFETIKNSIEGIIKNAQTVGELKVISSILKDIDAGTLRKVSDLLKQKSKSAVVILGSAYLGSAFILVSVTDDLVQKGMKANELIKPIAAAIDGTGGGRPDLAQAGSKRVDKIERAIAQAKQFIAGVMTQLKL